MLYRFIIVQFLILLLCGKMIFASHITGQSNYFGVRAAGLGGCFTAVNNDISGISYNPASISEINRNYFYAMYINDLFSLDFIKQNVISIGFPLKNTYHSLSYYNTTVSYDYNEIFGFDNLDWRESNFNYTFAFPFLQKNFFGFTAGYSTVRNNLRGGNAEGYNFNAGYIGKLNDRFSVGFSLLNIIGKKKWDSGLKEDEIFAYRSGIKFSCSNRLHFLCDIDGDKDESLKEFHFGSEFLLWSSAESSDASPRREYFKYLQYPLKSMEFALVLRGGLRKELYAEKNLNYSLGLSFKAGSTFIDYAFEDSEENLGNTHMFALNVGFGGISETAYEKTKEEFKKEESKKSEKKEQETMLPPQKLLVQPTEAKSYRIAIFDFQTFSENIIMDLNKALPKIITKELRLKNSEINFIPPDVIKQFCESLKIKNVDNSSTARKIGILLNADYIIAGSYNFISSEKIIIRVQIYATDTGMLVLEKDYFGNIEDIFDLMNQLSYDVQKNINY